MEKFRMFLKLAKLYHSGEDSHWRFSQDMAKRFVESAERSIGLNLDSSMSVEQKIRWMECL